MEIAVTLCLPKVVVYQIVWLVQFRFNGCCHPCLYKKLRFNGWKLLKQKNRTKFFFIILLQYNLIKLFTYFRCLTSKSTWWWQWWPWRRHTSPWRRNAPRTCSSSQTGVSWTPQLSFLGRFSFFSFWFNSNL